ncbi:hypothetical protein KY289_001451 [Solanum tuberosum]|nr:hypothetical protein KY289_001451 [Solanum tuberosum]
MDVRRRPVKPLYTSKDASAGEPLKQEVSSLKASDALPLPLYLTTGLFFTMFFSVMYFLLVRWREKIRRIVIHRILRMRMLSSLLLRKIAVVDHVLLPLLLAALCLHHLFEKLPQTEKSALIIMPALSKDDEEIIQSVVQGKTPSYSLESKLGDCMRATSIRKEALQRITGKSLEGLPLEGFDYESILRQCCEMPVGYVQILVGIAGPLLLDGREYSVPMATTEGCLVASTNRGCKAIFVSGGADNVLLRDGMTRAPVVRFSTAKRVAELKFLVEDPNFALRNWVGIGLWGG